jgi:hypothetical protein
LKKNIENYVTAQYEVPLRQKMTHGQYGLEIVGFLDVMNDNIIYEIKCVQELSTDHFLQVIVYAWLWITTTTEAAAKNGITEIKRKLFRLINVTTSEVYELENNIHIDILFDISYELIVHFLNAENVDGNSDEEFIIFYEEAISLLEINREKYFNLIKN